MELTCLRQMSQLNRGDALWLVTPFSLAYHSRVLNSWTVAVTREPAPLPYFERAQLGDVGYIRRGCFHLLFSAGSPVDGRELGVDVPRTFKQLEVGRIFNTQPRVPGYLSTNTVRETTVRPRGPMYPYVRSAVYVPSRISEAYPRLLESGSSITFQLTRNQGATLLTGHPTYREDVQLGRTFEEYTKAHYDSWVTFARERGHPDDIKPILVTGVDMTREFAMLSYSNEDEELMAEFTISAPGISSPWGTWRTPGVIHTNCGPQLCRPPPARPAGATSSGDSHTETVSDEYNQCVFVRYYTVRKRLGIPRVIKAAAGPHNLDPGGRDDEESPVRVRRDSDSGSDIASSLFDDDGDDGGSSVSSTGSDTGTVIHNTTPVGSSSCLSACSACSD